jgi:predicted hydrocarbon binding protein
MTAPEVPIDVDPATGVWRTDGLPMLYVPRHFFLNNHLAIEAALGREAYARLLYEAGHRSAWAWCEAEALTHGMSGTAVFRHYMRRLSQRGWGRFGVVEVAEDASRARVRVDHSLFVLGAPQGRVGTLCYMFAGWFPVALQWVRREEDRDALHSVETQCAGDGEGHDHCLFEVAPTRG